MSDDTYNLALRVPLSLIKRLDALTGPVRDSLDLDALVLSPKVTRSTVARLALLRGVEMLEAGKVPDAPEPPAPAPKPRAAKPAPAAPKPAPKVTRLPPGPRRVRKSSRTKPPLSIAGVKIRAWREQEGLKQAEAADRLGVVQSHWSRIERGEMLPSDDVADRLDYLVGGIAPGDWTAPNPDAGEEA